MTHSWAASGLRAATAVVALVVSASACDANLRLVDFSGLDAGALLGGRPLDGGGGADAGSVLPEELCDGLVDARCQALLRCGLLEAAGASTCWLVLGSTWCGPTTWPSHLAVGALRLDATAATACAAGLADAGCEAFPALPPACDAFLQPAARLGQACYDGYLECSQGVCRGATCPKSCQLPAAPGEACGLDGECQAGLACLLGRCQAPPAAGQACVAGRCAPAAFCGPGGDGGTCRGRLDAGVACGPEAACGPELLCLGGSCLAATVASGPCQPGQRCAVAGEVCLGAADAGACGPALDAGSSCRRDEECQPALACRDPGDGGAPACGRRLVSGERCLGTGQCQLDAACAGGRCQPRPLFGQACDAPGAVPCLQGLCQPSSAADGGWVCGPLLGPRAPCSDDAQCASGHCTAGACLTACTP